MKWPSFVFNERLNLTKTEMNIISIHFGNIMQPEVKVCEVVRAILRILRTLLRMPDLALVHSPIVIAVSLL